MGRATAGGIYHNAGYRTAKGRLSVLSSGEEVGPAPLIFDRLKRALAQEKGRVCAEPAGYSLFSKSKLQIVEPDHRLGTTF